MHFDPLEIENKTGYSTYNLALTGTTYRFQKFKLLTYLKYNKKPKILIWVIDLNTFNDSDEFYGYEKLMPFSNIPEVEDVLREFKLFPEEYEYFPIVRYSSRPIIKYIALENYFFGKQRKHSVTKGYSGRDLHWDEVEFENLKKNKIKQFDVKSNESEIGDFKDFVTFLKDEGIFVILAFSPIYYEIFKIDRVNDLVINKYKSISINLGVNFLDYSDLEMNRDAAYFFDANHLNINGVNRFTPIFSKDLSNLLEHSNK